MALLAIAGLPGVLAFRQVALMEVALAAAARDLGMRALMIGIVAINLRQAIDSTESRGETYQKPLG